MFSGGNDQNNFDYQGNDLEAMIYAENYYSWIVDIIGPYIGKSVVESGSGTGAFSQLLLKTKPNTLSLIEPSKTMHAQLARKVASNKDTKVVTYNSYLKNVATKLKVSKPDTFVYINVFEHIDDDRVELGLVANLLPSGGHVVIFVPALGALYSKFDKSIGHYRRYDKAMLKKLVKLAGLDVVKLRYMDMPGILPWWVSFVLMGRKKLVPALVSAYDKLCVPVIRAVEDRVEAPLGKNLLLIARKR